jgi:hypothetical protein
MNIYYILAYLFIGIIFAFIVVHRKMLWNLFGYWGFEVFLRVIAWPIFLTARLYNYFRYGEFK